MNKISEEILTKEKFIDLLQNAKQDEYGHYYIEEINGEGKKDEYRIRRYFTLISTVCDDFVKAYVYVPERDSYAKLNKQKNSYRYDRHFTSNDDSFECLLVKNLKEMKG